MARDIFTKRWIVGGIVLFFITAFGCAARYTHDTEPAADAPTENIKPTAEKHKPDTVSKTDVRVSPYGFGAYPDIPSDFPQQRLFSNHYGTAEAELLDRVRVKLWKEGIRPDGIGWLQSTGLYYPTVRGTIYVRWGEFRGKKYITRLRSHPADHFDITKYRFVDDIPSHLKVLDFSEGIDPYEYLGLSKEADE